MPSSKTDERSEHLRGCWGLAPKLFIAAALCVSLAACAKPAQFIPGTRIPRTSANERIVKVIERYRQAVERKDAAALLLMASKKFYYEDGGTQTGTDDYGYDGLKDVLASRFQLAKNIRCSMRYLKIRRKGDRAFIEVFIDASFSIKGPQGEMRREDVRDQNQLVLIRDGETWKFVAGM